ncbi:hypothetical protein NVP2275O_136 [Vibrio phage 2.275.O._10N.286.54.E11]|nr:hypothetical protein NVP2275O_136 [Vibrio phage 2.275.O._10N.286.54.E11]
MNFEHLYDNMTDCGQIADVLRQANTYDKAADVLGTLMCSMGVPLGFGKTADEVFKNTENDDEKLIAAIIQVCKDCECTPEVIASLEQCLEEGF